MFKWVLAVCDTSCGPPTGSCCTVQRPAHRAQHKAFKLWRATAAALGLFYSCESWKETTVKCDIWTFFLRQVFQTVSGATHAHVSAPKSARLWHRWEHHPRGSDMRRGAPGIIQAHAAVEIQVATTPVSITMNQALCASPTEPRAPIWQPLVGGRRTGYPPDPRWGLPHPKLSFEASFCSVIAPLNW